MPQIALVFLLCFLPYGFSAWAQPPDSYAGRTEMNGFSLKDFSDFEKKWRLVTVRYREDTKEMRFTYANEAAANALASGKGDYPDGAVFAKIGFISEHDPAFANSIVPSGAKRYQFMVRDKKKFSDTDGWGYVLFNGNGQTFTGEPRANSMACAACHRLVQERKFVFSQFANFAPFVEKERGNPAANALPREKLSYETKSRASLSARISRLLPSQFTKVRWLKGPLQKNIFDGTVGEVGPVLALESLAAKMPAVLSNDSGDIFAFAYPDANKANCEGNKSKVVVGRSIGSNKNSDHSDETIVKMVSYCSAL